MRSAIAALSLLGLAAMDALALPLQARSDANITTITTWDPPTDLSSALDQVWNHTMATYTEPMKFLNYGFDNLIANNGSINYCVRWDSNQTISAANRTKVEVAVRRAFNNWITKIAGFDGFPYETADVNVVGWATYDKANLLGDTSGIQVYTENLDVDGVPECNPGCGRAIHYTDNDYSSCPSGDKQYHLSAWLTDSIESGIGGYGGDWGQEVSRAYFMENIDIENMHILEHEMGHTLGLDDFYTWMPTGVTEFIMNSGSATYITDFDAWMARDWWRHLKSRYTL